MKFYLRDRNSQLTDQWRKFNEETRQWLPTETKGSCIGGVTSLEQ